MFNQTFVDATQKTRKKYTIAVSLLIQIVALSILILIPLVYTEALPGAQLKSLLVAPTPPPAPKPPVPKPIEIRPATPVVRIFNSNKLTAPRVIPKQINPVQDVSPAPDIGVPGGTADPNAAVNGVPYGLLEGTQTTPPPLPSPPARQRPAGIVRLGGVVAEANLIRRVQPAYPPLAKSARVSGTVEFTATISKEGIIENLQLMRGHPLLVNAAREAVLQWRYRPTMLNGQPVEVVTDIVVNFILNP